MGRTMKILTGLGVLAGISYFGKRRRKAQELSLKGAGVVGYVLGLGRGFKQGMKTMFRLR